MADVKITVSRSGPYLVKGEVELVDRTGRRFVTSGKGIALCRCGRSAQKPFCDGTHGQVGFDADTCAADPGDEPAA